MALINTPPVPFSPLPLPRYIIVGLFGALTFREDAMGDILKNYSDSGGAIAHLIEGLFSFSICMTYPLVVFPMRESLDNLLMDWPKFERVGRDTMGWTEKKFKTVRLYGETVLLVMLAFCVAILVPSVEAVFGITGSTMGACVSFFLPAGMYMKAHHLNLKPTVHQTTGGDTWCGLPKLWAMAVLVLVISVPMTLAGFIETISELSRGTETNSSCV